MGLSTSLSQQNIKHWVLAEKNNNANGSFIFSAQRKLMNLIQILFIYS